MKYQLYFDGNKTPQGTTCSYVIIDENKKTVIEETLNLPAETTVNEAEYNGLINGIKKLLNFLNNNNIPPKNVELEIYGDSQLVIKQLKNEYECKKPQLRILRSEARNLLSNFSSFDAIWIERNKNLAK